MRWIVYVLTIVVLVTLNPGRETLGQNLQYSPYGAGRVRAVARDGLFRVQKYRSGNGITQTGGSMLTTLFMQAPQIITAVGGLVNPLAGGSSAQESAAEEESAAQAPSDIILDALRDPTRHRQRMDRLETMYRDSAQVVTLLGGIPPTKTPDPQTQFRTVRLRVAGHPSLQLTSQRVRDILSRASDFLRTDDDGDGLFDASVDVDLVLDGEVQSYNDAVVGGIIDTPQQMAALRNMTQYDLIVVPSLTVCGNDVSEDILGCALVQDTGRPVVVELHRDRDVEAIVWAHELAHAGGLRHRNALRALMRPFVNGENRFVDRNELSAFDALVESPARDGSPERAADCCGEEEAAMDTSWTEDYQPTTVLEEVKRIFIHGIPYKQWRETFAFVGGLRPPAQTEIDTLLRDQKDNAKITEHGKLNAMLCAIGTPQCIQAVLDYVTVQSAGPRLAAARQGLVELGRLYQDMPVKDENIVARIDAFLAERREPRREEALQGEEQESLTTAALCCLGLADKGELVDKYMEPPAGAALDAAAEERWRQRAEAVDFAKRLWRK